MIAAISLFLVQITHKDKRPLTTTHPLLLSEEPWRLQIYLNRSRPVKASRKCRPTTAALLRLKSRKVEEVEEAPVWVEGAVGEVPRSVSEEEVLLS